MNVDSLYEEYYKQAGRYDNGQLEFPTTNLLLTHYLDLSEEGRKDFIRRTRKLPKALNYRQDLEQLLDTVCVINSNHWILRSDLTKDFLNGKRYGKSCDRICLTKALVVRAFENQEVELPIRIHHIWTAVDTDWKERNNLDASNGISVTGVICLYPSKGRKNFGIQALSATPYKQKY